MDDEEKRCWCGSTMKGRLHNCIGTRDRVEGLLNENSKLRGQVERLSALISTLSHADANVMGSLQDQLQETKRLIERQQNSLNKIHDLAGQLMGPDAHPNLGAIQAWVHEVSPCKKPVPHGQPGHDHLDCV